MEEENIANATLTTYRGEEKNVYPPIFILGTGVECS